MTPHFEHENAAWRRCEAAWSGWLQSEHYTVVHLGEAVGNTPGTRAPLIAVNGKHLRAPDLQAVRAGTSEYWEVKFRTRPDTDRLTGERVHWTAYEAFRDYLDVAQETGCKVWLVLFEAPTSTSPGRWLRTELRELREQGRKGVCFGRGGEEVSAWIWPAAAMEVVPGPTVDLHSTPVDLLPGEGEQEALEPTRLEPVERRLRKPRPAGRTAPRGDTPANAPDPTTTVLANDPAVGLDVLRRSLGIPELPRYSVLRVGLRGVDVDALLGLLHYGIRVFLISSTRTGTALDRDELRAFEGSRLLEWAVVGEAVDDACEGWVVDGAFPPSLSDEPDRLEQALDAADVAGGINAGQYRIVHVPADSDMLVTAGAGTGKTETMSERVVYLLATSGGAEEQEPGVCRPYDLRADEIVLMTFTREAARQMRERIGRTLMLRQRLCRRSVLPALAWMMQLSNAEITTIHAYAKRMVQSGGGVLGLGPGLAVSRQTMAFRALLHEALSPRLEELIGKYHTDVPASHLWHDHIQAVWDALENNGVEMMPVPGHSEEVPGVDWGGAGSSGLQAAVEETTRLVVNEVAVRFRALCLENQSIPTSELVPFALAALRMQDEPRVRKPRYLFVDEFQDTDALQMDLVLEISTRLGAKLFVVGDAKQGIYRFRGAEGNAFKQLRCRARAREIDIVDKHTLSRNFRSGALLLDSLHRYFAAWDQADLLVYKEPDRLRPHVMNVDTSERIDIREIPADDFAERAATDVKRWRAQDPGATIAILCRRNRHAVEVQSAVRDTRGSCELLVGGSFFTSPAVRELYVLVQAVAQPSDDAALLQLCETRWAAGILHGQPPPGVSGTTWGDPIPPIHGWHDRVGSLAPAGTYDRSDLEQLRQRIRSLGPLFNRLPVMAWIVECARAFVPEASRLPFVDDDSERRRYARCFDHLVILMDLNFKDGPVTLQRVLSWLQLQIATNRTEDEPVEWGDLQGRTIALTVHKAKGLEFDRVLVPNTWTPFKTPKHVKTRVSVLRGEDGRSRVVWLWKDGNGQRFSNVSLEDKHLWAWDDGETAREEARLLYVALTRAKDRLRVYLPDRRRRHSAQPSSWADLMDLGR